MNVPFNPAGDLISTDALVQIISKPEAHGLDWVKRDTLVFTLGRDEDEMLITARRMNNMMYKVRADRERVARKSRMPKSTKGEQMKYEFEKAKDLSGRVYALVQIGRYISIDAMLAQVKQDEVADLKAYLRRYFLNTHGMPQEAEMKAWEYQQEGAVLGWDYLNALYSI